VQDWIVPVAAGVLALVALILAVVLLRARSRTERALSDARAETADLRAQLDALEQRLSRPAPRSPVEAEFVITHLGTDDRDAADEAAPEVSSALFADLVLRETVVKAASLAHGVRRALDPETRNRIRFEMKREVKRARKQRRAVTRQARREWEARQRSSLDPTLGEEGTAA
jgi:type II secretory pathway component PulJ